MRGGFTLNYKIGITIAVLAMSVLCLILAGCSDDPTGCNGGDPVNHVPELNDPVLASRDQAMVRFKDVMESRNIDQYIALMRPDFTFVGKAGVVYDRDVELSIMNKLFNELAGEGGVIISNIVVSQLDPQGVWVEIPDEDENFGGYSDCRYRQYEVNIKFYLQGQNVVYQTTGFIVFYMINSGTAEDPIFKLLGIKDQTNGDKGVQNHSLTGIKELFN